MHQIVQRFTEAEEASLHAFYLQFDRPPPPGRERQVFVLNALLKVLAIMATYEDKCRKFLNGLIEEHKRG